MNLYVLRHGIAVEPGTPGYEKDSERPLTPKGKYQLRPIAAAMKKMDLRFDLILSSPFLRAKQTAEIIAESLKLKKQPGFSDALTPDGNPKALIRQLNELKPVPENVLLVGHEPYLSQLITLLTAGETGVAAAWNQANSRPKAMNLRAWQDLSANCNFPSARANLPCGRFDSLKATREVIPDQSI